MLVFFDISAVSSFDLSIKAAILFGSNNSFFSNSEICFIFLSRTPIDLPPIISVELIQIADKTIIPFAPKAKKIIEKVKKKKRKISFRTGPAKKSKKRKT